MNSAFLYRIFNISSGKQKKLFKGSQGEDGTLIKVSTPVGLAEHPCSLLPVACH